MRLTPKAAGVVAGVVMLAVYAATLAPGLTFWDSGELIAATESLGVAHPPGIPLYILVARVFSDLAPLSRAAAMNLLSALCTAAAIAVLATLVARWMETGWIGLAAGLAAGASSTVWRSAIETEVYAPAMLVSVLALWAADRAASEPGDARIRYLVLCAYLLALAVPLHLGVLVVAPAAAVRAAFGRDLGTQWGDGLIVLAIAVGAAAAGRGSLLLLGLAMLLIAAAIAVSTNALRPAAWSVFVAVMAFTAVAYVPVRAAHDPAINTGFATDWDGLIALLSRTQYDVPGLWPRQAPLWAQIANWFEYADWQWALSLGRDVMPTVGRTAVTLLFAVLGVTGLRAHWRQDRRSALVMAVLFAGASLGLVLYMNFKLGASFGHGVLPDDLPHEARDRDYFFVLGFAAWGLWAGIGAAALLRSWSPALVPAVIFAGAIPIALNWSAVSRKDPFTTALPRAVADALLWSAPRDAVLVTGGDNDSFPLWYEQVVHGARPDVRVVVAPLLGATWYRAELARRDGLLPEMVVPRWAGERGTLAAIDSAARRQGRPLAIALTAAEHRALIPARERAVRGLLLVRAPGATGIWLQQAAAVLDTAAVRKYEARFKEVLEHPRPGPALDPTERVMHAMLACPAEMRRIALSHADSLAQPCSFR